MSLRLALIILGLAIASAYGERVNCRQVSDHNGQVAFDCVSVVPSQHLSAQNQYILWLKSGRSGQDHAVDINVPNYRVEDVIQAAAKGGDSKSHTNINVKLDRPEFTYQAQKEERVGQTHQSFGVNLEYQSIDGRAVHFADEGHNSQRYTPLSGNIREP